MTADLFAGELPSTIPTYPEHGTLLCTFVAYGTPVAKGSKKYVGHRGGHAVLLDDNIDRVKPWQREIRDAAREAMGGDPPVDLAVEVRATFCFPLPASAPLSWMRHRLWARPRKSLDADKLGRCLLDALQHIVITNDSRVVTLHVEKRYVGDALALSEPGVAVEVRHA